MVQQLRVAARVLALAGYGPCYSLAGALFAWVSFLIVALWLELKVGDHSTLGEGGSILGGFLVAACLAWRAKRNTFAHFWVMVLGITQTVASGVYMVTAVFDPDRSLEWMLLTGWACWIGVAAAIAAFGGLGGLIANKLRDSVPTGSVKSQFCSPTGIGDC
jgi:hypothetical protein